MKLDTKEAYQQINKDKKTMTFMQIIEKYHLCMEASTLRQRLNKFNKTGDVPKHTYKVPVPTKAQMLDYHARGLSSLEAIAEFGETARSIVMGTKIHGIKLMDGRSKIVKSSTGKMITKKPVDQDLLGELIEKGTPHREIARIIDRSNSFTLELINTYKGKKEEFTPVYMTLPAEVRNLAVGRWV